MQKVGAYTDRATESGEWRSGNPGSGITATPMLAAFFNMLQRELVSVVEGSGLSLDISDEGQLWKVIKRLAALDSPVFTGLPRAPSATFGDSSLQIATTEWVQAALGSVLTKSVAGDATVTLNAVEARYPIIILTGVLTANISIVVPAAPRCWAVANRTTGSFILTVKTRDGSGAAVNQSSSVALYCDGVNVGAIMDSQPGATTSSKGVTRLATASETRAMAATDAAVTPASLAKLLPTAWVLFNGTGTVAIRDSYNVSSITDNRVGDYTITFATPMNNTNFAVSVNAGGETLQKYYANNSHASAPSVSANQIVTGTLAGVGEDAPYVSALYFGGKA